MGATVKVLSGIDRLDGRDLSLVGNRIRADQPGLWIDMRRGGVSDGNLRHGDGFRVRRNSWGNDLGYGWRHPGFWFLRQQMATGSPARTNEAGLKITHLPANQLDKLFIGLEPIQLASQLLHRFNVMHRG